MTRHPTPVPVGKQGRQQLICELIAQTPVHSQEQLVELLAERGVETTQTTLSRDLAELGVVKGPQGYALTQQDMAPSANLSELRRAVESLLVSIDLAANLVVMKTRPGRAQLIGYELDRSNLEHVVGTLAGDDTLFVATRSNADAEALKQQLENLAGVHRE